MSKLIIDVSITNHQFDVFAELWVRDHGHPEDGCAHRVADVNQFVTTRHSHDEVQRSSDFVPPVIIRSKISSTSSGGLSCLLVTSNDRMTQIKLTDQCHLVRDSETAFKFPAKWRQFESAT